MQALPWAGGGTFPNKSTLKSTCVHQQGGCARLVLRATSLAHALTCPHKGQRVGSIAGDVVGMTGV